MSKFGFSSQSGGAGIEDVEAEEDVELVELESLDTGDAGWVLELFDAAEPDATSLAEAS